MWYWVPLPALLLLGCNLSDGPDGHTIASMWPTDQARDTVWVSGLAVDNAETLYNHFDAEYLLCLEGDNPRDNYVEITDFRFAHLVRTNRHSLQYDVPCEALYPRTVATLHNHRDGGPGQLCFMSKNDIISFLNSPFRFAVVQCGPRRWSFFRRAYVETHKNAVYIPAIPSLIADFPKDPPGESVGEVEG